MKRIRSQTQCVSRGDDLCSRNGWRERRGLSYGINHVVLFFFLLTGVRTKQKEKREEGRRIK